MLFELASARWVWRSACTLEQSWAIHSTDRAQQGPLGPYTSCQIDSSWFGFIDIYWYLLNFIDIYCLYSDTFYSPSLPSSWREQTVSRDLEQPENPILRLALLEQMGIKGGYKVGHTAPVGMSSGFKNMWRSQELIEVWKSSEYHKTPRSFPDTVW